MMPMMPPMMGGAGGAGAARSDRDPVHSYDPDQQELHGIGVVADAVPGGTIAQRRRDD